MQLFQSTISQWINKLQAQYLCQNNPYYIVYHISENITIIKTINVLKHKKRRVHFSKFKTWVTYESCFIKFFILFSLISL